MKTSFLMIGALSLLLSSVSVSSSFARGAGGVWPHGDGHGHSRGHGGGRRGGGFSRSGHASRGWGRGGWNGGAWGGDYDGMYCGPIQLTLGLCGPYGL